MESLYHFLEMSNFVFAKCQGDTSHPRWLHFRFAVASGVYRSTDGKEWDNRLGKRKEKA